ncbi:MAG TPA: metal ABC transporter substrate-binding protein [Bacilli bacterium]|nr:metal ABC transporter substrate-binding protein [Bacilli bacterium]
MKKKKLLLLVPLLLLSSCNTRGQEEIITSSFIAYDLVHEIAKDKISHRNLVPWGSELHDYEPNAQDVVAVNNAKLFIYTTPFLETWVKNLVNNENAFALSEAFTALPFNPPVSPKRTHAHDHEGSGHFWTDPTTYLQLINAVRDEIKQIDADNAVFYDENADFYYNEIASLHQSFNTYLTTIERQPIYFAGHNALDAFAARYELEIISLADSYSPSGDLTPQQLIKLIEEIYGTKTKYIYIEELAEPRVARQIKTELKNKYNYDIELLELHAYHNIAKNEAEKGVNYAQIFAQNISNLKLGLSD